MAPYLSVVTLSGSYEFLAKLVRQTLSSLGAYAHYTSFFGKRQGPKTDAQGLLQGNCQHDDDDAQSGPQGCDRHAQGRQGQQARWKAQ